MIKVMPTSVDFGFNDPRDVGIEAPYVGWTNVEARIMRDGKEIGHCNIGFYVRDNGETENYEIDGRNVYYSVENPEDREALEAAIDDYDPVGWLLARLDSDLPPEERLYHQFLAALGERLKNLVLDDWKSCRTPEEAILRFESLL